eukprot:2769505-Prymnesium_polylepis.1
MSSPRACRDRPGCSRPTAATSSRASSSSATAPTRAPRGDGHGPLVPAPPQAQRIRGQLVETHRRPLAACPPALLRSRVTCTTLCSLGDGLAS